MAGEQADFKTKFYNLQGSTIQERKKGFYKLLQETPKSISNEELNLEPRNFLEELYRVEALIYFHQIQPLMKILKEGNVVFISKIIKQKWFFQEAFVHISEESFVNEILPTYSYSLRMKILKKVTTSVSEAQMDILFDLLVKRYGLFIALTNCSSHKIKHVITNNVVKLSPNQLKVMFDKDKTLIPSLLEEGKNNTTGSPVHSCKSLLPYIAQKDPAFFLMLHNDFKLRVRLGRRTSKGVIKQSESTISRDLEKYEDVLNLSVMSRKIKTFHQLILQSQKVSTLLQSPNLRAFKYLKTYPQRKRWSIFATQFNKRYGQDILDNLVGLHQTYIDLSLPISDEIKSKWAELNYKTSQEVHYLVDCETKFAIPLLKEKINLMSNQKERGGLLVKLIDNCLKHKDLESLEEILNYVCTRHRNEMQLVRSNILDIIENSELNLCKDLNDTHWKYINELLTLHKVRSEYYYNRHSDLKQAYVEYLYSNKSDRYEIFSRYIKDDIDDLETMIRDFALDSDKIQIHRDILTDFGKILTDIEVGEQHKLKVVLLEKIVKFNEVNPNHQILAVDFNVFKDDTYYALEHPSPVELLNDRLRYIHLMWKYDLQKPEKCFGLSKKSEFVKIIRDYLEKCDESYGLFRTMCNAVKKPHRSNVENQILDLVFINTTYNSYDVVEYFLKNEPRVILGHADKPKVWKIITQEWYSVKKCSFLSLDQMFIKSMVDSLSKRGTKEKIDIIKLLSKLMPTKDFLKITEPFVPEKIKLDLQNLEQREVYQLQCEVVTSLKNVLELPQIVDVVMQFFQGDYLQSTLPILYKLMYRLPETEVSTIVQILSNRAVSARKHALFLTCELLPVKLAEKMYCDTVKNEKNASNKKNWFVSALKYFVKNPSDHFLEMLCSNLDQISEHDTELLEFITKKIEVPHKYQPKYIEGIWSVLERLEIQREAIDVKPYQESLLSKMTFKLMCKLDKNFVEHLIKKYFLWVDFRGHMCLLVCNYLRTYTQDDRFTFVFEIIKKYKIEFWQTDDKDKIRRMFNFFSIVYSTFDKTTSNTFAPLFKKFWEQTFTCTESFQEHFALDLLVAYDRDDDLRHFAREVNILFKKVQENFGIDSFGILELTRGSFHKFFKKTGQFCTTPFNSLSFANSLLIEEKNLTNMLFAISELQNDPLQLETEKNSKERQKLVDALQIESNPIIQIKLVQLFKTYTY